MCRHESEVQIINKVLADQWQGAVLDSTVRMSLSAYHYAANDTTYSTFLYSVQHENVSAALAARKSTPLSITLL